MLFRSLDHLRACGKCASAHRERRARRAWEFWLCDRGMLTWDALADARAGLEREKLADAQPITGQGTLL